MNKKMLIAGGIINLIGGIFHLSFWRLFDWPNATSCLLSESLVLSSFTIVIALLYLVPLFTARRQGNV